MSIKKIEDISSYISELNTHEDQIVFLKFEADWCGPCKAMKSVIEEVSTLFPNVKFLNVDVEGDGIDELLKKFDVRSVPTFVQFKNNGNYKRLSGTVPKSELIKFISEENFCE